MAVIASLDCVGSRHSLIGAGSGIQVRVCVSLRDCGIVHNLVGALDILPFPTELLWILVTGAGLVWSDLDGFDVRRVRSLGHVKKSSSPSSHTRWAIRISSVPDTEMKS